MEAAIMDMAYTVSLSMSKIPTHLMYFRISIVLLLVVYSAPTKEVTEKILQQCIPANSTLAQTANCQCYSGGRGGRDERSCGFSKNLIDLVCSGVSGVDLPTDEAYRYITCL